MENHMKKLMTILLALSFMGTTIAVGFAQEQGQTTKKSKKKAPPKAPKKTQEKK
jgi:preprotein translocase subunit SecG